MFAFQFHDCYCALALFSIPKSKKIKLQMGEILKSIKDFTGILAQ